MRSTRKSNVQLQHSKRGSYGSYSNNRLLPRNSRSCSLLLNALV